MVTKAFLDVTRVDPSLAKGMLKRMVREHREHGMSVMDAERASRANGQGPGSRRAGPMFRRNREVILKAMGYFAVETVLLKSKRGKPHSELIIGLDPLYDGADAEGELRVVVVSIDKKKGAVKPMHVNAAVAYHTLERVLERHQLKDLSKMWKYVSQIVWGTYCVAACEELKRGTHWVYLPSGMTIVDKDEDGASVAKTWIPKELFSVSQWAFYNTYDAEDISAIITNSTFTNRPPRFRRKVQFAHWKHEDPYVVLFEEHSR